MAQFAVYRNKDPRTKAAFPFLVDIQSDLLELLNTRVVIPMTKGPALAKKPVSHLTPEASFNSDRYVLLTPQLAGVGRGIRRRSFNQDSKSLEIFGVGRPISLTSLFIRAARRGGHFTGLPAVSVSHVSLRRGHVVSCMVVVTAERARNVR